MKRADIIIDKSKCTKCRICMDSCFVDVIRWDEQENLPTAAYPEDCAWCLTCEMNCPGGCLEVIPKIPVDLPSTY